MGAHPRRAWFRQDGGTLGAVAKQTVTVDDVVSAVETARDKVMADEVKSLVKLGLPKSHALKMVAERYRQREEAESGEGEAGAWVDMG